MNHHCLMVALTGVLSLTSVDNLLFITSNYQRQDLAICLVKTAIYEAAFGYNLRFMYKEDFPLNNL